METFDIIVDSRPAEYDIYVDKSPIQIDVLMNTCRLENCLFIINLPIPAASQYWRLLIDIDGFGSLENIDNITLEDLYYTTM